MCPLHYVPREGGWEEDASLSSFVVSPAGDIDIHDSYAAPIAWSLGITMNDTDIPS